MAYRVDEIGFVHLHTHSSYSLLEGAITVEALAKLAVADKQPALALTDTNNLYGALEFSEKLWSVGVQPIIGSQLSVDFGDETSPSRRMSPEKHPHLVFLAMNEAGYRNLLKLVSAAALETSGGSDSHVTWAAVAARHDGLIVLTGGPGGPVDHAIDQNQLELAAARLAQIGLVFGDRAYVEIQRHGADGEAHHEAALLKLAYDMNMALVATNEPFFAKAGDYEAHDALMAIAAGRLISDIGRRKVSEEHYFATRREMKKRFSDLPEALAATVEIAQRVSFRPETHKSILPRFGGEYAVDEAQQLQAQAEAGLEKRITEIGVAEGFTAAEYHERLAFELGVIARMQYPGYFLIVADFIQEAKRRGIPVGPGRGSGAGSLVAYALTITDVDPLRFGLLFERFLNPDRVSMPDFDIDFCQDRREEVIDYVRQRYGEDRVAQIITFGTLQARGVMRDVGRVLEMPYGQVDKLTKLVPQNPANPVKLAEAIKGEPKLQAAVREEPVVARMLDIAQRLEGLHRHASTHAAGIVIGDRPLDELVPLVKDHRTGMRVTQFNMKWVEQAGLVKFDFLGLKTLTVLTKAVAMLKQRGVDVVLDRIPLDDVKTYELLARGETIGVFQLESAGMRKALIEMKADRIEDIIALVALYRPGPMENIPKYCRIKLGQEEARYLHPKLEAVLAETHGIIVYQEQVMQVAQLLSGYSLGEADLLRRAMGKKIKKEMDDQRDRFIEGATGRDLTKDIATEIFDLLAKFADYGFNKSHAAAYAIVSYQTAWLKTNHPVEFLAASMALDMDNTDKLAEFRRDAGRSNIIVEPPSINRSGVNFEVHDGKIRYALAAVKGVGRQAVESLITARGAHPFRDLGDLARRIDPRNTNKRTLEALISAGALDELEPNRAKSIAAMDGMMALANRTREAVAAGQSELFGGGDEPFRAPQAEAWTAALRLQKEHEAVGFFLSGHPLDDFAVALQRLKVQRYADFARTVRQTGSSMARIAASVTDRTERRTKTGNKMGIVQLSDQSGHFDAVIFSEGLQRFREILEPGRALLLKLSATLDGDEVKARIEDAEPLEPLAVHQKLDIAISVSDEASLALVAERLMEKGDCKVRLVISPPDIGHNIEINLPGGFAITPPLMSALRSIQGVIGVEMTG